MANLTTAIDPSVLGQIKNFTDVNNAAKRGQLEEALAQAQIQKALQPELPANIKEYALFQKMTPEQQKLYTTFIKAKTPSYGGNFTVPSDVTDADPAPIPSPEIQPETFISPAPAKPSGLTIGGATPQPITGFTGDRVMPEPPIMDRSTGIINLPKPTVTTPKFYQNENGEYAIKGAPAGFAWADVGGKRELAKLPGAPDEVTFKNENMLRDEFNTRSKDFITVQDAYSKIKKTSSTGAGDMSMLYAYVKLLDPGSVVRESEFATAAASGSYGERIQGAVKGIIEGGRLSPSLRQEFLKEADNIYQGQKEGYDRLTNTYTEIAKRNNLKPENVITNYAPEQTEYVKGQIYQGANGRYGVWDGKQFQVVK